MSSDETNRPPVTPVPVPAPVPATNPAHTPVTTPAPVPSHSPAPSKPAVTTSRKSIDIVEKEMHDRGIDMPDRDEVPKEAFVPKARIEHGPSVDDLAPPYLGDKHTRRLENSATAEAYGDALRDAEKEVKDRLGAGETQFNVQQEIRTRALEKIKQWVIVDTLDGQPLRLNDKTTISSIGQWTEVTAADVEVLRSLEQAGKCKCMIRPPGWQPQAVK